MGIPPHVDLSIEQTRRDERNINISMYTIFNNLFKILSASNLSDSKEKGAPFDPRA